jgi:signal transduction histidine kinase
LALKDGRYEEEGWRVRKDGTTFWANIILTPLFDKNMQHIGFTKVTRDLTERRKAENDLRVAYDGLEEKIKEKTIALEKALNMRDEFLSIASHELKTPITSIKLQLQASQIRLKNQKDNIFETEKVFKSLQVTVNQVNKLTRLIDDLLDMSRIHSGKLSYTFAKMNFSELLDEILPNFNEIISTSLIKTNVDTKLEGYWDRLRIEQVIVNLITNAHKYAPETEIIISANRIGENAVISVQDFGPGIPDDFHHKIFERFERLGQTKTIGGLGLGLYISKQVVLAHGGTIEFKSGAQSGATFLITLPLVPPSAKELK